MTDAPDHIKYRLFFVFAKIHEAGAAAFSGDTGIAGYAKLTSDGSPLLNHSGTTFSKLLFYLLDIFTRRELCSVAYTKYMRINGDGRPAEGGI